MASPSLRTRTLVLGLALLTTLLVPLAAATPDECVTTWSWGPLTHVEVDPTCLDVPGVEEVPVLPGMEPSCFERELVPQPAPPCCDEIPGSCCELEDVPCLVASCQPGDLACLVTALVRALRERISQEAAGHGICLDVGQNSDGTPYANVDATRPCTQPPPS